MTSFSHIKHNGLSDSVDKPQDSVDLASSDQSDKTPLRVDADAFALFDLNLGGDLDELEGRFADFVTKGSLGSSLQRNR
jgi:hypothetical protein